MIINKDKYSCVWTAVTKHILEKQYNSWFPNNFMDFFEIDENEKVFYVEFMGIDTFLHYKIEEYVPLDIVDKIRKGEITLLLHCTGHGPHEIVEQVYEHVIGRDKVPIKNLILSSESHDLHDALLWYSNKYKRHNSKDLEHIRLKVAFEFEAYATQWAKSMTHRELPIETFLFENKKYDKKFLSLNGLFREHRAAIVWLLASYDLLNDGFVSFNIKEGPIEKNGDAIYEYLSKKFFDCTEFKQIFETNKEKITKIESILFDTSYGNDNIKFNLADLDPAIHNKLFNNSYFSICTETNFPAIFFDKLSDDYIPNPIGRLYSEKIFRCILYKHPFLAVSNPKFLEGLRSLGYKTFHPVIDESYDQELNHGKRLVMIAQEAKRLCELNENELAEFLAKCKEIADYNFEVLKNKTRFSYDLPFRV
jgi:hypothetical protein